MVVAGDAAGASVSAGENGRSVGSYLPMPDDLQCSMHWFPPPVNYPLQYYPGC